MAEKYCRNCKQMVTPTQGTNLIVFIILLFFFLVPAFIYLFWAEGKAGKCPICGSKNWGTPPKE